MGHIESLEKQNKQMSSEMEKLREENIMLRDANIQFQLKIFKLKNQLNSECTCKSNQSSMTKTVQAPNQILGIAKVQSLHKKSDKSKQLEESVSEDYIEDHDQNSMASNASKEGDNEAESWDENNEQNDSQLPLDEDDDEPPEEMEIQDDLDPEYKAKRQRKPKLKIDAEYVDPKLSQDEIQQHYKIRFGPIKLGELNFIPNGVSNDSKFINLMIPWLFDKKTLLNSQVSEKRYIHPVTGQESKPLDRRRVQFMKGMITN